MYCKTCKAEKAASEFYVSNQSRCKECTKAATRKNRLERIDYYREYDKARASMPHRVSARAEYQQTRAFAQSHSAAARRWTAKHPERRAANYLLGNAVRDGRVEKLPCFVCGADAEAHHPDYSQPLAVVWLCPAHHKQAHALVRKAA